MGKFAKKSGIGPPKKSSNDDSERDNNFFNILDEKKDDRNVSDTESLVESDGDSEEDVDLNNLEVDTGRGVSFRTQISSV